MSFALGGSVILLDPGHPAARNAGLLLASLSAGVLFGLLLRLNANLRQRAVRKNRPLDVTWTSQWTDELYLRLTAAEFPGLKNWSSCTVAYGQEAVRIYDGLLRPRLRAEIPLALTSRPYLDDIEISGRSYPAISMEIDGFVARFAAFDGRKPFALPFSTRRCEEMIAQMWP